MKEKDDIIQEGEYPEEPTISTLLRDLTNYKNEGCELYKQKKIEEAKLKFKQGHEKFEKDSPKINQDSSEDYANILSLHKKILSNLALCYYKQKKYKESIDYDIKLLTIDPKFGKSIVRIFNAFSRMNKIQQAVGYGDMFLELDQDTRNKFKGIQDKIQEQKLKLKNIETADKERVKKEFGKYVFPFVILCLAIFIFLLFKKK